MAVFTVDIAKRAAKGIRPCGPGWSIIILKVAERAANGIPVEAAGSITTFNRKRSQNHSNMNICTLGTIRGHNCTCAVLSASLNGGGTCGGAPQG